MKIKQGNNAYVQVFKFQTSKDKLRNVKKEVCELTCFTRSRPTAMLLKQSKKVVQVKGYIEKQVLILTFWLLLEILELLFAI